MGERRCRRSPRCPLRHGDARMYYYGYGAHARKLSGSYSMRNEGVRLVCGWRGATTSVRDAPARFKLSQVSQFIRIMNTH
jgi:hypothetical protein